MSVISVASSLLPEDLLEELSWALVTLMIYFASGMTVKVLDD